jgi:NitT/TauT family transport system substrate-binding protein
VIVRLPFRFGRSAAVVTAGIVAVAAAGCGGDSGGDSGSGGVTTVKVGYVPYADDAPAFLAQEKGIFRKHGLNVEFVPAANPTAIVAAMLSGQQQFGFVTDPVLINVNTKGTPLKCVAPVVGRQPSDEKRDGTALIAAKGSGIKSVKDLAGKKVATVQLNSLNTIDVQVLATQAGIDQKSIQFIQVPFPQIPAALSQGRVQAGVVVQPFAQTAIEQGGTVINHPNSVLWGGGTTVCFGALGRYVEQNPELVKGFNAAMREAILYTKDHESEAKATLVKRLNLSPDAAQKQVLQTDFDPTLTADTIDKIQAAMKQYGLLQKTMPGSEMIWEGAL